MGRAVGAGLLDRKISRELVPAALLVSLELSNSDSQARLVDFQIQKHEVQRTSSLPDGKFWYVGCPAASCAGCSESRTPSLIGSSFPAEGRVWILQPLQPLLFQMHAPY
jgi:hypothetical protein